MSQAGAVIVHGSVVVRKGLKAILEEGRWLHVGGEAGDMTELRALLGTMEPAIILVSPLILDAASYDRLVQEYPTTFDDAILIALGPGEGPLPEHFRDSLDVDASSDELLPRLRGLLQAEDGEEEDLGDRLSEREVKVLREIVIGQTNKEVGDKLFISPHTVITHRKNITRKIGIRTLSGLTVYAIMNGIVSMEEIRRADNNSREHEK